MIIGIAVLKKPDGSIVEKAFKGECMADVRGRAYAYAYRITRQYKVISVKKEC